LLRTKRTLVLPAHVNLTLITNSYDVVHSWFVPGLGLKIDCVPGRSTHHTFYVDNIGFYYGQCAEICGRYHHHMPIRLCALPFEHFVVWWQSKGAARMNRTSEINNNKYTQSTFNNPVTREKIIYRMN
jgi:heme/copper-type cytochrome/quinol oxidase subunit 2